MPLPAHIALVPIHGQILHADGTPAKGQIAFHVPQVLRDTTGDVIIGPDGGLVAVLDAAGEFTISVPATDDPDITPIGWVYKVSVHTDAWVERFDMTVPAATVGTIELADVAPAVPAPDVVTYVLVSEKGSPGGVATLDGGGKILAAQLPGPVPVAGSRGGNAALAALLTVLADAGLIVDNTTP